MHDAAGACENPRARLAIPISVFRARFLASARIKRMATFEDKTRIDSIDPVEALRGGDRRALAMLFDQYRDRL
jgi:hypothetical protein